MKLVLTQMNPIIGDFAGNSAQMRSALEQARSGGAEIVLFPEMSLCGYPPDDFLLLPAFRKAAEESLQQLLPHTRGLTAIVGTIRCSLPGQGQKFLFNTAAVCFDGQLLGYYDKVLLPTYDVFDEARYFEPGGELKVWNLHGKRIGITICEDMWQHGGGVLHTNYPRDPILEWQAQGIDLLLNLSASPYSCARHKTRTEMCQAAARTLRCPVVLCNQVGGNDSLIFDGNSVYVGAEGSVCARAKAFQTDLLWVDLSKPCVKMPEVLEDPTEELYHALVLGLKDYFRKQGLTQAVVGLSGGIDSAVVACLAVAVLGAQNVHGVGLPSRFSSEGSVTDARQLAHNLGMSFELLSVEGPFQSYLDLLAPTFGGAPFDVTEENLQARIRGALLMALSNKKGYIVLATGNKSEMAMGYATLYGDMCGGLGVLSDVTKQQVYALANWINRERPIIPQSTITKPPSAELRPNQKDSDSLPDYAIIDAVVEGYVEDHQSAEEISASLGYPLELVQDLIKRIHRNEYKRRQSAPGLRVSQKAFSIGRRFPIVQKWV